MHPYVDHRRLVAPNTPSLHYTDTAICLSCRPAANSSRPGGYSPVAATDQHQANCNRSNISLPSTIPCNECRKPLPQSSYSAKRLEDLRNHVVKCAKENVRFDPKTMGFVRCSQCVGVAPVELKCNGCSITFRASLQRSYLLNFSDVCCSAYHQVLRQVTDEAEGGGSL